MYEKHRGRPPIEFKAAQAQRFARASAKTYIFCVGKPPAAAHTFYLQDRPDTLPTLAVPQSSLRVCSGETKVGRNDYCLCFTREYWPSICRSSCNSKTSWNPSCVYMFFCMSTLGFDVLRVYIFFLYNVYIYIYIRDSIYLYRCIYMCVCVLNSLPNRDATTFVMEEKQSILEMVAHI